MNFQNDKYSLYIADENDNEQINNIFNSGKFEGRMCIQYLRGEKPIQSFNMDGKCADIICIRDNEKGILCAVGGAVIRNEYINGEVKSVGYLTGLKLLPEYQRKIRFLSESYQFLYEIIKDKADVFYTTILSENENAIKMLEKKHKKMPVYDYMGMITTYCFNSKKVSLDIQVSDDLSEFDDIKNSCFAQYNFAPYDINLKGFGEKTFYTYRDDNGEIIASCFLCNQQENKQYFMCGYGGALKFISKLPVDIIGYPKFPKPKSYVNYCVISCLYVKDNDVKLVKKFLETVSAKSGFDICLLALFENHPLNEAVKRMKTVHYYSNLYQVIWDDKKTCMTKPIHIEAALL